MGAGALIFGLGLVISTVESFSDSGQYRVLTTAMVPLHFENEYIKYDGELIRVDRNNKVLSGNCTVKQRLGPIGIHVEFFKKDPMTQKRHGSSIQPFQLDKICGKELGVNEFLEKFKCEDDPKLPSIDLDTCTVEDKKFNLKEWNIEPHIKKGVGDYFFYGVFDIVISIFGKPDGDKQVEYGVFELEVNVVSKFTEDHMRNQKKKKGNKKDHEEKDVTDPETHSDPEKYKDPKNYKPPKF